MYPPPCHPPIATITLCWLCSKHWIASSSTLLVLLPLLLLSYHLYSLARHLLKKELRGRVVAPPPFTFCDPPPHHHDRLLLPLLLPCVTTQEEEADANHPNAPIFNLPPPLCRCRGCRCLLLPPRLCPLLVPYSHHCFRCFCRFCHCSNALHLKRMAPCHPAWSSILPDATTKSSLQGKEKLHITLTPFASSTCRRRGDGTKWSSLLPP